MSDAPIDTNGLPEGYNFRDAEELTPRVVNERLKANDGLVLVDCREDDALKTVSINGALHIPLGKMMNEPQDFADELPQGKDTPTAIICHSGRRSLMATLALRRMGFANVYSVAGGIDLWARDVDTSLPRY
jgi:rhodanese-related sulfurtransferase